MRIHPPIPGHSPGPFCAGTCLFAPMVLLGGTSELGSEGGVCAGPQYRFYGTAAVPQLFRRRIYDAAPKHARHVRGYAAHSELCGVSMRRGAHIRCKVHVGAHGRSSKEALGRLGVRVSPLLVQLVINLCRERGLPQSTHINPSSQCSVW